MEGGSGFCWGKNFLQHESRAAISYYRRAIEWDLSATCFGLHNLGTLTRLNFIST